MHCDQNLSEAPILNSFQPLFPAKNLENIFIQQRQIIEPSNPKLQDSQQKLSLMETLIPQIQIKKGCANNLTQKEQELELRQSDKNQILKGKYFQSSLQSLQALPRNISKNKHIKIQCKTQFPLVRAVAVGEFGWSLMSKQNHRQLVDIIWTDTYVTQQLVNRLRPYQKINHFPYSSQMGRKDYLFANLNKMRKIFKDEYDFYAKTWIFPQDYERFRQQTQSSKWQSRKFYIGKPVASCQGKGIHLGKRHQMLHHNSQNKLLVQQYLQNTLLIEGLKFDLRIYVLIKSLEPLNIYVYGQGLTRLATNQYQKPNDDNYKNGKMHLTNYAINKNNPDFIHNDDFKKDNVGHKRSLAGFYQQVQKMGGNQDQLRRKINKIIVKAVLPVYEKMTFLEGTNQRNPCIKQPTKKLSIIDATEDAFFEKQSKPAKTNSERSRNAASPVSRSSSNQDKCFQLLGFDIMIQESFQPKLIQINHQPSLTASSPLDYIIKKCLLVDVFNLLNLSAKQRQRYLLETKDKQTQIIGRNQRVKAPKKQVFCSVGTQKQVQLGGFTQIYPTQDSQQMGLYHKLLPILLTNHSKKSEQHSSLSPTRPSKQLYERVYFRQNKTCSNKVRKLLACNEVNIFTNGAFSIQKTGTHQQRTLDNFKNQLICNPKMTQSLQTDLTTKNNARKTSLEKMREYSVSKNNLNFTIKYKKNQIRNDHSVNSAFSHTINSSDNIGFSSQQKTKLTTKLTNYNSRQVFSNQNCNFNLSRKNVQQKMAQTCHSSYQNRIGIKIMKQKSQRMNKFQLTPESLGIQLITVNQRPMSLQNHSRSNYERKSPFVKNEKNEKKKSQLKNQAQQTRDKKGGKRSQYLDRIYQKELMSRIQKMKKMKEKLDRLRKTYDRKQQKVIQQKGPLKNNLCIKNENKNKNENDYYTLNSNQGHSPAQYLILNSPFLNQKACPFRTIQLLQLQKPQSKTASHKIKPNGFNKQTSERKSLDMFRDEAFLGKRKKLHQ